MPRKARTVSSDQFCKKLITSGGTRGISWQLIGLNPEAGGRGGCLSQGSRKTAATLFLEEDI